MGEFMDKPIGRSDALQALENLFDFCEEIDWHLPDEEKTGYQMLPDYLLVNQYIKENEQKHGHWTNINSNSSFDLAIGGCCSECNLYSGLWTKNQPYKFCPYCGAKMDE